MNKNFNILLALALTLSNVAIAATETDFTELDSATPPLARLTNIGTDQGVIFEVRAKDLEAAKSKAKVDPIILGRVRGIKKIANFSTDFNKPTFSIATFKVVGNTEEWVATTSHRYHLRKGSARFRLPLVGLTDPNTKYRFYILTDTGATYAGPYEGTFSPADDALVTSETDSNEFPAALPTGFTKTQLDGIAKYILQRLVILPQSSHRDITSSVQLTEGSNNFVLTLPTASTPVNTFEKKVKLTNTDNGTSTGNGTASIVARGNYSATASYQTGDIISNDSSSFIANKGITAGSTAPTRANINDPAVAANWTLLVAGPAASTTTVINNTTAGVTPKGAFNTTSTYIKGDTVIFGGSTFLALQDIAANSALPNVNSAWALLSSGMPVVTEENISLPASSLIKTATLDATNPGGGSSTSPATVITLQSSSGGAPITLRFNFTGGTTLVPVSYEYSGTTTNFGGTGPALPTSNGAALNIPGELYSIFFSANKINVKNQPAVVGGNASYTARTINIDYKAF